MIFNWLKKYGIIPNKMPKVPMDYSNCVIYKIVCNDVAIPDCYVGHSTNLVKRRYSHKTSCTNPNAVGYEIYVYKFIRENGGWDNWSVIEIEKCPCLDKQEACKNERKWIETLHATLNKQVPLQTQEDKKKYDRDYFLKNKARLDEYHKKWVVDNKEYLQAKYELNRESLLSYQRQYAIDNKDRLRCKINCECGGKYVYYNKSRHFKTKLHSNYVNGFSEGEISE